MQRDDRIVELSSEDETETSSHTTTAEFLVPEDLLRQTSSPPTQTTAQLEDEPRRWKKAEGSQTLKELRFSIGAKSLSDALPNVKERSSQELIPVATASSVPEYVEALPGPKGPNQHSFIEDVRKKQRRATITRGKSVVEDIWLNKQGFGEFYDCGRFSDVTLVANGKEYRVHRLILAFSSEHFAKLLSKKDNVKIVLDAPDPENVMPDIVKYMYTSEIAISAEKAVALLAMADLYAITDLKLVLSNFISGNVKRENAVTLLRKAIMFHAEQIALRCVDVVASNFPYIYDVNYDFLPYNLLLRLIYHAQLNVLREHDLYVVLRSYVLTNADVLDQEQKARIMSAVRYRWFNIDELIDAMQEGLVPKECLLEATFARLEEHEHGKQPPSQQTPLHLQPRPVYPVAVRYQAVPDRAVPAGVIDWIGRAAGRREWVNPHVSGEIVVSASSLCKGVLADLLSTKENELWSNDVPASWFCLDFGAGRSVNATSYVLRHGGNYRADSLRNWDLQGSQDERQWEVLMSHRHDSSLQGPFAVSHWELPETKKGYRYFRVLQTGHNSSSRNFLVLSNIELYGLITDKMK